MSLVFLIFLPILAACLVPLLFKKIGRIHTGWFVLIVPLVLFVYYATLLPITMDGGTRVSEFQWIPSLGLSFVAYLDGLSLLFSLLITGIGSLVVLYSVFYLDKNREQLHNFYVYLLMFMTAMLGIVQSDHMISLYLFWELTSISSFLLIGYWYTRDRSRFGALKSMMITVFGGLMMLGGFVLLSIMGNTYSIRELVSQAPELVNHEFFTWALVLILLGAFTKSAQFPFYIWLPDAMEAPTPVSAYLHSATMVKAGLYLVARFTPIFAASGTWIWLVTGVGLFTMFWGSFFALKQKDLKAILAFSTVSQLGLIMSLLGASALGFHVEDAAGTVFKYAAFAAIFHLVNHAVFKGSLFMVAGIVDHETGTRDIRKLGGLMSIMPISFTLAMIGSFSMAGIPLFGGFLSKEMFLTAMLAIAEFNLFSMDVWGVLFPVLAWIGSVFTFVYSFYFVFHTFAGKHKPEELPKHAHEAPIGMLVSPAILAALVIIIFFIPNLVGDWIVKPAVLAIQPFMYSSPDEVDIHVSAWHGANTEFFMTLGIFAVGALLFWSFRKWKRAYEVFPDTVSLNRLYDTFTYLSDGGANRFSAVYMTGFIRSYLVYMFGFLVLIVLSTLVLTEAFVLDLTNSAPVGIYGIVIIAALVGGTTTILFAKSRLTSIIALGAVGYSVALFFVMFRAPDLALTQLVIETISVALFLLAFYHLPKVSKKEERMGFKLGNAAIALGVGVTMTLVALASHSQKVLPSISEYYKETVYSEAGGGNIVNVILVDYRGFDTLFEITVLGIAGIAIITMIKLRLSKKEEQHENK
ncbi:Na+/H+ antiporter subunit A [Planococcus shenhongbingii]|uniref:Na+/H+ antiporter subunit A n=1 Tax=Planococcus shenhongbingii TaxID=3058398 RepID=A0ABT8NHH8_9BACL|nr:MULTISPECIES: Na+/H+ antiporter subunit A [unclassified Planococcus (in: firmicutes)]MDN7247208.1 Na+/H+ antiporter subunit A [Planococcus sp. N017]WKA59767.1 Na+/H+ antiporter subunit A [Planococcus sp. N016]